MCGRGAKDAEGIPAVVPMQLPQYALLMAMFSWATATKAGGLFPAACDVQGSAIAAARDEPSLNGIHAQANWRSAADAAAQFEVLTGMRGLQGFALLCMLAMQEKERSRKCSRQFWQGKRKDPHPAGPAAIYARALVRFRQYLARSWHFSGCRKCSGHFPRYTFAFIRCVHQPKSTKIR